MKGTNLSVGLKEKKASKVRYERSGSLKGEGGDD